eukprot:gnl/Chilomastix_cuspidata/2028.p1 GENE.gnl/Chilomastix_cuspidata/2028~~gnl/Chilomastix_cuspidata/2028.p1  ORF type:complete len:879 (+),score=445.35 gnl/Chilomastix_cuspidata/2028:62-2638(+)
MKAPLCKFCQRAPDGTWKGAGDRVLDIVSEASNGGMKKYLQIRPQALLEPSPPAEISSASERVESSPAFSDEDNQETMCVPFDMICVEDSSEKQLDLTFKGKQFRIVFPSKADFERFVELLKAHAPAPHVTASSEDDAGASDEAEDEADDSASTVSSSAPTPPPRDAEFERRCERIFHLSALPFHKRGFEETHDALLAFIPPLADATLEAVADALDEILYAAERAEDGAGTRPITTAIAILTARVPPLVITTFSLWVERTQVFENLGMLCASERRGAAQRVVRSLFSAGSYDVVQDAFQPDAIRRLLELFGGRDGAWRDILGLSADNDAPTRELMEAAETYRIAKSLPTLLSLPSSEPMVMAAAAEGAGLAAERLAERMGGFVDRLAARTRTVPALAEACDAAAAKEIADILAAVEEYLALDRTASGGMRGFPGPPPADLPCHFAVRAFLTGADDDTDDGFIAVLAALVEHVDAIAEHEPRVLLLTSALLSAAFCALRGSSDESLRRCLDVAVRFVTAVRGARRESAMARGVVVAELSDFITAFESDEFFAAFAHGGVAACVECAARHFLGGPTAEYALRLLEAAATANPSQTFLGMLRAAERLSWVDEKLVIPEDVDDRCEDLLPVAAPLLDTPRPFPTSVCVLSSVFAHMGLEGIAGADGFAPSAAERHAALLLFRQMLKAHRFAAAAVRLRYARYFFAFLVWAEKDARIYRSAALAFLRSLLSSQNEPVLRTLMALRLPGMLSRISTSQLFRDAAVRTMSGSWTLKSVGLLRTDCTRDARGAIEAVSVVPRAPDQVFEITRARVMRAFHIYQKALEKRAERQQKTPEARKRRRRKMSPLSKRPPTPAPRKGAQRK